MNLKPQILKILRNMSGEPLSQPAIVDSVRLSHPAMPEGEITGEIRILEAGGYIAGTKNEILNTTLWVLTDKGRAAVAQL